jgi:hypothetical protein
MSIYQGNIKVSGGHSKSPYQYALDHGYTGTESEFYASFATTIEYGTEDLTAGTSELATGKLYFVYE